MSSAVHLHPLKNTWPFIICFVTGEIPSLKLTVRICFNGWFEFPIVSFWGPAYFQVYLGLSKNSDTPKSSILKYFHRVFHYFHHSFWGPTPVLRRRKGTSWKRFHGGRLFWGLGPGGLVVLWEIGKKMEQKTRQNHNLIDFLLKNVEEWCIFVCLLA